MILFFEIYFTAYGWNSKAVTIVADAMDYSCEQVLGFCLFQVPKSKRIQ